MPMRTLQDALAEEIQDLLSAEQQIARALPKMAEKASEQKLKNAFQEHQKQTETQIRRLEQVCESIGVSPKPVKCEGIEGILAEGEELMKEDMAPDVMNAMLIASAQKVEHYEIASYGTVTNWAETLQHSQAVDLLRQTLDEEKATDHKLTELATQMVNPKAKESHGE
jgi:ferritin-like metal-binding protein YciE